MNEPRLRFKGFKDEWKEEKLKDIGIIKSGYGFPESEQRGKKGIPFFKVSDIANSTNKLDISNNYVNDKQIKKNKWKIIFPKNKSIIFAKVGAALIKNRKRLVENPFLIDNNIMSYSFDNSWNPSFGIVLFNTIYLPKYAQTGALPSFNASDINYISIMRPKSHEQQKIGSFFEKLDQLIQLQSDKLEHLKITKKGYLQKMFPSKNKNMPKITFNKINSKWKMVRIGEISDVIGGGTPNTSISEYWNGNINWFSPNEIGGKNFIYESSKKITKLGLKKSSARLHPINTILFTSRAGIGKMAILKKEAATNQGFQSLELKDNYYSYFIYLLLCQILAQN